MGKEMRLSVPLPLNIKVEIIWKMPYAYEYNLQSPMAHHGHIRFGEFIDQYLPALAGDNNFVSLNNRVYNYMIYLTMAYLRSLLGGSG